MNDRETSTESRAGAASAPHPTVERVRVLGGPLHGNTYAVTTPPAAAVAMESLAGTFIYRYTSVDGGEPQLQYVGPAAPVVGT